MRPRLFVVAAAMLAASLAAHADVIYSYVGTGGIRGLTFTIDSPDFLSYSYTDLVPVTSGTLPGPTFPGSTDAVQFATNSYLAVFVLASDSTPITFLNAFRGNVSHEYNLDADGVYTDIYGDTLTVTGSPSTLMATPEPSTIALLGTGLLGVAGVVRKWST